MMLVRYQQLQWGVDFTIRSSLTAITHRAYHVSMQLTGSFDDLVVVVKYW